MQINEVMNLTIFRNFRLIAGKNGLNREITNVDILEYEWFNDGFEVFNKGDFIITSLFFAKDNQELIEKSFIRLIEKKISGIAIKTIFFKELPPEILKMADDNQIPLFLFSSAYMEDIIIAVNELLKSKQKYLLFEEKIYDLIDRSNSREKIASSAHEINPHFKNNVITFYLTFYDKTVSPREITNYLNRLFYKQYRGTDLSNISLVKYKEGLMIFYTFTDNEKCDNDIHLCKRILRYFDIPLDLFCTGISNSHKTFTQLDISIQESIYADKVCYIKQKKYLYYSGLDIYSYLIPLMKERSIQTQVDIMINILLEYDKKYTSSLLKTLLAYVKNNGEISKTAAELFQHPNTIRYRLQKVKDLLAPYLDEKNFYEYIFIFMNLYLLKVE
nr:PucR family transcriptional regulator [Pectinatus frisingensis]